MNLSMIVAADKNSGIGKDNALPWPHNKDDMVWFVSNTKGKIVVMGRKTWESLPRKPLPNRTNIVVTQSFFEDATICLTSEDGAKALIEKLSCIAEGREVVVIGGAKLYETLWPYITKIYDTRFDQVYDCDVFFDIDKALANSPRQWKVIQRTVLNGNTYTVLESDSLAQDSLFAQSFYDRGEFYARRQDKS